MSQPAAALAPLPFELVYSDGKPLETDWHAMELPLLRELIYQAMAEQGRRVAVVLSTDMACFREILRAGIVPIQAALLYASGPFGFSAIVRLYAATAFV